MTPLARALLAAGAFSLISLLLISTEGPVFLTGLPLFWLALVGLLTLSSLFTSIFKDLSVKEGLTLFSIIGASTLGFHLTAQRRHRPLLIALVASGIVATLVALPEYLSAPPGSELALAPSGSFHYPNGLGSFLLLLVFLPLPFVFHPGALPGSRACLPILAMLWAALMLTHSRGVWAAGMVALAVWVAFEWRLVWAHRRSMLLAVVLIASLILMASRRPADIAPRLASLTEATSQQGRDPSFQWRHEVYASTLNMIKDRPFTGMGLGTFAVAIKLYQRAPYVSGLYAHSHYLQTAAEMGLPALAALLLFLGFLFRRSWKIITSLQAQSPERSLAVCLAAGLLGSSLHAAVDFGWSFPAVALVFGVEASIVFGLATHSSLPFSGATSPRLANLRGWRPLSLFVCLVMALVAGTRHYAEFLRNEGKLALDAGDRERAVAALRWSSRLNPLSYSPRHLLASAFAAQGDLSSSQREAEAAFRLDPFDGDAFHDLARIHWLAGRREKAESEFLSAVRLQPYTRPIFYYDLAEFYLATGKPSEAEAWLTRGAEIFKPEIVTSRLNRCIAPGDRYILARMYWRAAEISWGRGRVSDGKQAEEAASRLAKPEVEEICFRGMIGPFASPEATIVAYWQWRNQKNWPAVVATFARDASQPLRDESLMGLPPDIEGVRVDWIASLVGNEHAATVGYEITLFPRDARVRKVAFTDTLIVERGGWRLRHRQIGLK